MRRWRRSCGAGAIVILAAFAAIVARSLWDAHSSAQDAGSAPIGVRWAYTTEHELVVMAGTKRIADVHRVFDLDSSPMQNVVWSRDANYLAMLDDATVRQLPATAERLEVVDVRTGTVRTFPCPNCDDVMPFGPQGLVVQTVAPYAVGETYQAEAYVEVDLSSGRSTPLPLDLPAIFTGYSPWKLVAGAGSDLLVAGSVAASSHPPESLLLVSPNGASQATLTSDLQSSPALAVPAGGDSVVVTSSPGLQNCSLSEVGNVVNADAPRVTALEVAGTSPRPPGQPDEGFKVDDLWQSATRQVMAVITKWHCAPSAQSTDVTTIAESQTTSAYVLVGRTWQVAKSPNVPSDDDWRLLRDGSVVALAVTRCSDGQMLKLGPAGCNVGSLNIRPSGGRAFQLSADALTISTPSIDR